MNHKYITLLQQTKTKRLLPLKLDNLDIFCTLLAYLFFQTKIRALFITS